MQRIVPFFQTNINLAYFRVSIASDSGDLLFWFTLVQLASIIFTYLHDDDNDDALITNVNI